MTTTSDLKFAEVDALVEKIAEKEREKDLAAEELKLKNIEIMALKAKVSAYLIDLGRTEYGSPVGLVRKVSKYSIRLPHGQENKDLLFNYMREEGVYDRYATVHATALLGYFMAEREAAIKRGEDPITFALPGMEPAHLFEDIVFKPNKKKESTE